MRTVGPHYLLMNFEWLDLHYVIALRLLPRLVYDVFEEEEQRRPGVFAPRSQTCQPSP